LYGLTLLFSLKTHSYLYDVGIAEEDQTTEEKAELAHSQKALAGWIGVLLLSTVNTIVYGGHSVTPDQ
jgi:Ca2+:H+ antiporter